MRALPTPTQFFKKRHRRFNAICDAKEALRVEAERIAGSKYHRREAHIHRQVAFEMVKLLNHADTHRGGELQTLQPKLSLYVLARLTALLSKSFTLPFQRNYRGRDGRAQGEAISIWHNLHGMLYYRLWDPELDVLDGGHVTITDDQATELLTELIRLRPLLRAQADGDEARSNDLKLPFMDSMALPSLAVAFHYAREQLSLCTIIQAAKEARRMDPTTPRGRLGLLRSLQIIGERCTRKHLSDQTRDLAKGMIDFRSLVTLRNRLSHPEDARAEDRKLFHRIEHEPDFPISHVRAHMEGLQGQFETLQLVHQATCNTWEACRRHLLGPAVAADDPPADPPHLSDRFRASYRTHVQALHEAGYLTEEMLHNLERCLEGPLNEDAIATIKATLVTARKAVVAPEIESLQRFEQDVWFWQSCRLRERLTRQDDRQALLEQGQWMLNMLTGILPAFDGGAPVTMDQMQSTLPPYTITLCHVQPEGLEPLLRTLHTNFSVRDDRSGLQGFERIYWDNLRSVLAFHDHTRRSLTIPLDPRHDADVIDCLRRLEHLEPSDRRVQAGIIRNETATSIQDIPVFFINRDFVYLQWLVNRYGSCCRLYLRFLEDPSTLPAILLLIERLQNILSELDHRGFAAVPTDTLKLFKDFRNIMLHGNTLLDTDPNAIPVMVITHHLPALIQLAQTCLRDAALAAATPSLMPAKPLVEQLEELVKKCKKFRSGTSDADKRRLRMMLLVFYHVDANVAGQPPELSATQCLQFLVRLTQQLSEAFKACYPSQPGSGTVWDQLAALHDLTRVSDDEALTIVQELLAHLPKALRAECKGTLVERQRCRLQMNARNLPKTYEVATSLRAGRPRRLVAAAARAPAGPSLPPATQSRRASLPPAPTRPPAPPPGSDAGPPPSSRGPSYPEAGGGSAGGGH